MEDEFEDNFGGKCHHVVTGSILSSGLRTNVIISALKKDGLLDFIMIEASFIKEVMELIEFILISQGVGVTKVLIDGLPIKSDCPPTDPCCVVKGICGFGRDSIGVKLTHKLSIDVDWWVEKFFPFLIKKEMGNLLKWSLGGNVKYSLKPHGVWKQIPVSVLMIGRFKAIMIIRS
ncbi:hypothetical protein QL285_089181 [Trifolium repens]|nr:hypothetical protein QL285_089181 [Trifolium repens]